MSRRFAGWCIYLVILCGAFALPLREFVAYAAHSDVHSYVLLIPLVTAYLIYIRWKHLSRELSSAWGFALKRIEGSVGGGSELVISHQRHSVFAERNAFSASWHNDRGGQRMQRHQIEPSVSDYQPPGSKHVFAHNVATSAISGRGDPARSSA